MDLSSLRIVARVAQHGSFAAAARLLDLDPSTVSRTAANVEAELGLRLFQRSTRTLSVTEEGAIYLAEITPLLEEFDRAEDLARNAARGPSGTLKMTTSVAFAYECVVPHLKAFTSAYPDIALDLVPTDENLDLTANGVDLAIRLAPAPRGNLISTKLLQTRYRVVASPEFMRAHPGLSEPADLSSHNCLRFSLPDFRTKWRFRKGRGDPFEVSVGGNLIIANAQSLRRAAVDGLGPTLLADWLVAPEIRAGNLQDVFPGYDCTATEFQTAAWALYPSRSYLPQKVRVMIDFLRAALAQNGLRGNV